ncbi:unnamed protein product [Adineta ricciae]|uniref:Tetratricopeptide repeat protein n=1 Tax=Adineta ricciae TaxID=249248 RepID=A0A814M1C9_ADIRI|nr:unnamed protein product [Adineta ricciae]CAF1072607.1 unnamed protein product [Adineta ricciae]
MATTSLKDSGIHIVVYDERDKFLPLIRKAIVEPMISFNHLASCMTYIDEITRANEATVIITTSTDDRVLKTFQSSNLIEAVYISSTTNKPIDKSLTKVIGVYSRVNDMLPSLFETLDSIEFELNGNSILFHNNDDGSDNLDFYFYQLWFTHNLTQKLTKADLTEQANLFYHPNKQMKAVIHEFNASYDKSDALRWIDKYNHPFPYYMLISNALRTHDQHVLGLVRFFISDMTRHFKLLSSLHITTQAYYGTKLPISIVDRLEHQTAREIIAFQCFLPATKSRANALAAAVKPTRRRKMVSVLFKIDAGNAYGVHMSDITLLDMATPFHVINVSRCAGFNNGQQIVTIVQLVALDQVYKGQLYEGFIQKQKKAGRTIEDFLLETVPLLKANESAGKSRGSQKSSYMQNISENEARADEYISRGEWNQAIEAMSQIEDPSVRVLNKAGCILREYLNNLPAALDCHERALRQATNQEQADTLVYLGTVYNDMRQFDEGMKCYSQALHIYENQNPQDPAAIARCLVGLGNSHWACKQLDEALDCAQRALALREKEVKPRNDFDIAGCLGNMGNILHDKGDMKQALACAKRAVDLLNQCGKGDPRLAAALNNLGAMYQVCGDYPKARENFQRALDALPIENHPYRISTLNNIARLNAIEKNQQS